MNNKFLFEIYVDIRFNDISRCFKLISEMEVVVFHIHLHS